MQSVPLNICHHNSMFTEAGVECLYTYSGITYLKIQHKMSTIWHNCVVKISLATLNCTDFPHLNTLTLHVLHFVKMKN